MTKILLWFFLLLLPLLVALVSTTVSSTDTSAGTPETSSLCNRTCHGENQKITRVPFPFGFSPGCEIQLNCSGAGAITVGNFEVQNVTEDNILINFPANCSRSIKDLIQLDGSNFDMTWRNGLLLDNCSPPTNGCALPVGLLKNHLGPTSCNGSKNNTSMSCYSGVSNNRNFFQYENVHQTGCSAVVSSVAVALDHSFQPLGSSGDVGNVSNSNSTTLLLNFQTLELGWWLDGECNCSEFATCSNFTVPNGKQGYRCKCNPGYVGDGFAATAAADSTGCRPIPRCEDRGHIFGKCGSRKVGAIIGGILAGASLTVVLALFYYCIRKRSKLLRNRMSAKRLLSEAAGNPTIPFFGYKDIERATGNFSEKQRLGTGAYGTVYVGKLRDDESVAIKKIKHRDHESIEQVINEIKLLSSVSHPNLVRLLGCCIENGEQILVYEFMPNGTLAQHLQRLKGSVLPWTIRLTIATETANAIAHLHSAMNPPIYHRDIKSSNILLDYNYKSKVADFGLSRFGMMDDSHISTAPQGTPGYLDPQYHQNFHLSDKSDVYSFGVVLVEIITAMKVVDFSRPHSEINLAALAIEKIGQGRLDEIIDTFLEPHRDAWTLSSIHRVAELAFRCLAFHRDMRPSMMEVAEELEQIRLSSWAPLEENNMNSSVASTCSSPFGGSEKSFNSRSAKKSGIGSRRLAVSQRGGDRDPLATMEESKDGSPVSVQDPWFSEQSSPSTNGLLNNVVQ